MGQRCKFGEATFTKAAVNLKVQPLQSNSLWFCGKIFKDSVRVGVTCRVSLYSRFDLTTHSHFPIQEYK